MDKLKSSLRKFYGRNHDLVKSYGTFVSQMTRYVPLVVKTFRSFPHSWLITGFVTRVTWRVSLVEQELFTLAEHPSSPRCLWGSCYSIFNFLQLVFCPFSFDHCVVCSSSIYGFWLPLWYPETLLTDDTLAIYIDGWHYFDSCVF